MNIPKFEINLKHYLVGKKFRGKLDGFEFVCYAVKQANNGLVLLGETSEYICQYYTDEVDEVRFNEED